MLDQLFAYSSSYVDLHETNYAVAAFVSIVQRSQIQSRFCLTFKAGFHKMKSPHFERHYN